MDATLVTGSTGLVGYHIVQALLKRGRCVKALVRSIDRGKALLPEACELVQGDITDQAAVRRAMEGCSVVYHAAGIPEQWLPDPARFTRRPPLTPQGGLYFLLWQAIPRSEKAQCELGWRPTPLCEGLRKTIAFLKMKEGVPNVELAR